MTIAKRHIRRLESMEKRLANQEAAFLKAYGPRRKGTARSSDWLDAEALRAVIAMLKQEQA